MNGFLGTGATRSADLNLLIQLAMAAALTVGMVLARKKRFRAHGWTQTSVLLLNLLAIGGVMAPSFRRQVFAHVSSGWRDAHYAVPTIHAVLGASAELLGLYVVLVAINILPERLRFRNYKAWMRTTLTLWWVVVIWGLGVYYVWHVQPSPATGGGEQAPAPRPVAPLRGQAATGGQAGTTISVSNYMFDPQQVTVQAGSIVEWVHARGRHQIAADDGSFGSDVLVAGARFRHTFDKPGVYNYYCRFHGEPGGKDMAGTVTVK